MKLIPARDWSESCDACVAKDGRCWCSLHKRVVKNMDTVRCKDWADRETGRAENERE